MIEVPDAGLRQQIVQVLNGSRERQLAFTLWAKRTLGQRRRSPRCRRWGWCLNR